MVETKAYYVNTRLNYNILVKLTDKGVRHYQDTLGNKPYGKDLPYPRDPRNENGEFCIPLYQFATIFGPVLNPGDIIKHFDVQCQVEIEPVSLDVQTLPHTESQQTQTPAKTAQDSETEK